LASPQRGIGPLHGGALRASLNDASFGSPRPPSFTDLRFSPAQRKKGSYGAEYSTIGRGMMRAADEESVLGYARRTMPVLASSLRLKKATAPRLYMSLQDYTTVFLASPARAIELPPIADPTPQMLRRANSSLKLAGTGSRVYEELSPRGKHEMRVSSAPVLSHEHAPLLNHKKLLRAKRPKLFVDPNC